LVSPVVELVVVGLAVLELAYVAERSIRRYPPTGEVECLVTNPAFGFESNQIASSRTPDEPTP